MADNPFADYVTPYTGQPNAATTDMTRELIKQLGERRSTPKYEGPGAWWGAVADMSRDFSQQQLMQNLQKQTEKMNPAPAMGAGRGAAQQPPPGPGTPHAAGVQPTPGVAPISGGGATAGATPSIPQRIAAALTGKSTTPESVKSTGELAATAGETPPEGEGGEEKVAQNAPNQFATNPQSGAGKPIALPRLETPEEHQAIMEKMWRSGVPVKDIAEYDQKYIDRSKATWLKGRFGDTAVTPQAGGKPPVQTLHPEIGEQQYPSVSIGKFTFPLAPYGTNEAGEPIFKSGIPGVGGDFKGTVKDWNQFFRTEEAKDKFAGGRAEGITTDVVKDIGEGSSSGEVSRILTQLQALNLDPAMPRGPTADWSIKAREFLDNVNPGALPKGASAGEVFQKLNFYLAAAIGKSMSSRVSNFTLSSAMQNNPGLMHTQGGAAMLIDLMKQEQKIKAGWADKVSHMKEEDFQDYAKEKSDYYKQNYTVLHKPGEPALHLGSWDINTPEGKEAVRSHVGNGEQFLASDGKIKWRGGPPVAAPPGTPTPPALRRTLPY